MFIGNTAAIVKVHLAILQERETMYWGGAAAF